MEKMKNLMGKNSLKQMFGKIESGKFALSFDGKIAIYSESEQSYQTWNKEESTLKDVSDFIIEVPYFFKMPTNKVSVGDLILINDVPHYVIENKGVAGISVLNVETGNIVNKVKRTNLLNFSFYVKVVSLFENSFQGSENSLENMLPLLMLGGSENSGENSGMEMMLMMQMMGGQNSDNQMQNMLPFLLMGKSNSGENSGMEMMLMMQMMNGQNSDNQMQNMLPFLLMGKSNSGDLMEMMLMMQMMGGKNIFQTKPETSTEKSDKK